MKVIRFNTPHGQYQIPLLLVAEHRADYYVTEKDGGSRNDKVWQSYVDWVMKDDFEGVDWLINNSNFEDWEKVAIKVNAKVNVSEDDFWSDSDDFKIVEVS